jgi:uncharacterized Zn-binding protein involved in type VI secretion
MGKRYYIHVGDETDAGGKVTTGLITDSWNGIPNSFEGDQIFCPACNSVGHILCVGTRISNTGAHGKQRALDGDLCICNCNPPPRLIASQNTFSTEGETGPIPLPTTNSWNGAPITNSQSHTYNERFVIRDAEGLPIPNLYFGIKRVDGSIEYGTTDENGHTEIMLTKEETETVQIFVAG